MTPGDSVEETKAEVEKLLLAEREADETSKVRNCVFVFVGTRYCCMISLHTTFR